MTLAEIETLYREHEARLKTGHVKQRAGDVPAWWGDHERPKIDGVSVCRMCPKPVARRRREYCSQACSDRRSMAVSPGFARGRVNNRDRGICSGCGFDTNDFRERFKAAFRDDRAATEYHCVICTATCDFMAGCRECGAGPYQSRSVEPNTKRAPLCSELIARGYTSDFARGYAPWGKHLWEMDHIIPVSEGGGMCDLSNLRTLCIPCHKRETAALKKRLARAGKRDQLRIE